MFLAVAVDGGNVDAVGAWQRVLGVEDAGTGWDGTEKDYYAKVHIQFSNKIKYIFL